MPAVINRLRAIPGRDVGIPIVALAELLYGAQRSIRRVENLARIAQLKAAFTILPLHQGVAERYGAVRADLHRRGIAKSDFDLLIACTATVAKAVLSFLRARGLRVTAPERTRVLGCDDPATLDAWIVAAATAASVGEVLATKPPRRRATASRVRRRAVRPAHTGRGRRP